MSKLYIVNILSTGSVPGIRGLNGPKNNVRLTENALKKLDQNNVSYDVVQTLNVAATVRAKKKAAVEIGSNDRLRRQSVSVQSEGKIARRGRAELSNRVLDRRATDIPEEALTRRTVQENNVVEDIKFDETEVLAAQQAEAEAKAVEEKELAELKEIEMMMQAKAKAAEAEEVFVDVEEPSEEVDEIDEDVVEDIQLDVKATVKTIKFYDADYSPEEGTTNKAIQEYLEKCEAEFKLELFKVSPSEVDRTITGEDLLFFKKISASQVGKYTGAKCDTFLSKVGVELHEDALVKEKKAAIKYILGHADKPDFM